MATSSQNCPKSVATPISLGTSLWSDKSVPFYKNPREFMKKHMNEDRVFVCRFAMRPTYVIASNALVKELLEIDQDQTYNGLQDFFFGLFGPNILFANMSELKAMREILLPLMQPSAIQNYNSIMEDLVSTWIFNEIHHGQPVVMYEKFKKFSTMLSLKLFLGLEDSSADHLSTLATTHWHGIISVPLNVKMSFFMSSSYRKATEAKEEILKIIEQRLEQKGSDFLKQVQEKCLNVVDIEFLKNTILLFTCALIPKALASLLTSFVDTSSLWYDKYVDAEGEISKKDLSNIFHEIVRLWPPFFGGLRVAKSQLDLGNFQVPEGYGIFYANYLAHRDPSVFANPEEFIPERWEGANAEDKGKIFGFGSGPHACVGRNLMENVMHFVASKFVKSFKWEHLEDPMNRNIKCLPVLRPRHLQPMILSRR